MYAYAPDRGAVTGTTRRAADHAAGVGGGWLQVQTQHNKRKSAAIRELLEQDATAAAVAGAGQEAHEGPAAAAGRGTRQATTDLFAGILAGNGQADGGEDSSDEESTEDGSMLADLAPLLQALKG